MVSIRTLLLFYRRHLRVQPLRELMAILGIAAGVAMLFAVQIANRSVTGSFEQLAHGIAGRATLEVAARAPQGFDQGLFAKVKRLPDVEAAAPLVERRIRVLGPAGTRAVTWVGFDDRVAGLGSPLLGKLARQAESPGELGLQLAEPTATAIGVRPGDEVKVEVGARIKRLRLAGTVTDSQVGSLAQSPFAGAPLPIVQELAEMRGRITRILVVPAPGREAQARAQLVKVSGDRLTVRPSDSEARLLGDAARPERQLTAIFSVVSLFVGILLAFNAILLAMDERRAFIAYLRDIGTSDLTIVASLAFDGLVLGVLGSILGLALGDLLSRYVFQEVPGYLAASFPLGTQRVVGAGTVALSFGAGVFAALAAAAGPAINLVLTSRTTISARLAPQTHRDASRGREQKLFVLGSTMIVVMLLASLLAPASILFGMGAFVIGIVLLLPFLVTRLLGGARRASRQVGDASLRLSVAELVTARSRSVALAATGVVAVFAILSLGGSAVDVRRSVGSGAADVLSNADVWVRTGGDENAYDTESFDYREIAARVRHLPGVKSVDAYGQSFLDLPDRRLWAIGVPRNNRFLVAPSQIIEGESGFVQKRLRKPGWAALTATAADDFHLRLGETFTLPTPAGKSRLRLAATITNYGWLPGTVVTNADEYRRDWKTSQAALLAVKLASNTSPGEGKQRIIRALGSETALSAETAGERRVGVTNTLAEGLTRLNRISNIVLFAAILAVVAVMLAAVSHRRERLDALVSIGMSPGQLTRMLFFEAGLILAIGCLIGMAFGLIGQPLIDKWIHVSTGSPVPFSPAWVLGLRTIGLALLLSVLAAVAAVRLTVRLEPRRAFAAE